jgi:hypothetical protein
MRLPSGGAAAGPRSPVHDLIGEHGSQSENAGFDVSTIVPARRQYRTTTRDRSDEGRRFQTP